MNENSESYELIERAIQYIEAHVREQPELEEIASAVGLSEYHFQRLFTRWAGISPKRFMQFLTKERAKELLGQSENLLDTTHQVGLSSLGRLHDLFINTEAVTPGEYKTRGDGVTIRYGLHASPYGKCLVAVTERGICHLGFVETSEGDAIDNLVADWKNAHMVEDRVDVDRLAFDRPLVGENLHAVDELHNAVGLIADQAGQRAVIVIDRRFQKLRCAANSR